MKYFLLKKSDGLRIAVPVSEIDGIEEAESVFSIPFYKGEEFHGVAVFREKIYAIINKLKDGDLLFLFLKDGRAIQIEGIQATVEDGEFERDGDWMIYEGEKYLLFSMQRM